MALPAPPEVLAELAAVLHAWEEAGKVGANWPDRADSRLAAAAERRLRKAPSVREILQKGHEAVRAASAPAVPSFSLYLKLATAIQMLDDWHAPLMVPATAEMDDLREAALRRLRVDGKPYNRNLSMGSVIPAAVSGIRATPVGRMGIVADLLHSTAYLPAVAAAGDPDDSSVDSDRTVELRYVSHGWQASDPRGEIDVPLRISIAPVLQDMTDAEIEERPGHTYGVKVTYDSARLQEIIAIAMREGAHVLFLPEMTVDAGKVDELASAIRRAASEYKKASGVLPDLRLVAAGVVHNDAAGGNNSIVLLDIMGHRILQQNKLCRWNLKPHHQRNYQLNPLCATGDPELKEDIPGGSTVWIADVEALGRFLTLICADMDYDKPGDLLVRSVAVDWLHAPIMDKSLAWTVNSAGELDPWIVKRAARAARNGVPRVVVTNSVLLTLKLNLTNGAQNTGYPVLGECAIGFLVDSSGAPPTLDFRQIEVDLPCSGAPIVETIEWMDRFAPLPPSAP
jgi:predicted amidohydrolase